MIGQKCDVYDTRKRNCIISTITTYINVDRCQQRKLIVTHSAKNRYKKVYEGNNYLEHLQQQTLLQILFVEPNPKKCLKMLLQHISLRLSKY